MGAELSLWITFAVAVALLLYLDLGVFHKHAHTIQFREAVLWSIGWTILALAFNGAVYIWLGSQKGTEFLTAYIERSLSVDNIFIFALVFIYFAIPFAQQHRVLFWGILVAVAMRAVVIAAGISLLEALHWTIYIFGAFLIFTGVKLAFQKHLQFDPEKNLATRLIKKVLPVTSEPDKSSFLSGATASFTQRRYSWPWLWWKPLTFSLRWTQCLLCLQSPQICSSCTHQISLHYWA